MTTLTIDLIQPEKPISPDLFGIFFEDLNYAADGGLYAELIQNRSFEYQATEQPAWNALSFWELTKRGGGEGGWVVDDALPLHPNNPHYVVLSASKAGGGVGIANAGFDGIAVKAGESYDVSFFARQLYMDKPWDPESSIEGRPMPVAVRLESEDGDVLAEASIEVAGRGWTRLAATLAPGRTQEAARFVLLLKAAGAIALDEVSLFPRKTFRDRPNGLRADLAQAIADLKPRFARFPGGCLAHGSGVGNFYRWKDTIGPIEQRRGQKNLWGYHQSAGLGYFEYFQFCEDIGAKPLPVVPSGVSCQNSGHTPGHGQQCVPMEDMPAYIADVLDLIEWANGPATSKWGARRAEAGHPEPFGLEYLGVGNEDHITPGFRERFKMIYEAVREKHPEITVIGTVGPFHSGLDYDEGWRFADELKLPMVDEHYYENPDWFWANLGRYDACDRGKSKIYLGEYAAHEGDRRSTLRCALAEAAYLTSLERNGDVVHFASYAPLLAKRGNTQWSPDLIYFNNTHVFPTLSYEVQKLFSHHAGDRWVESHIETSACGEIPRDLAWSTVRDSFSGDVIVKIVNGADAARPLRLELRGLSGLPAQAAWTVFSAVDVSLANEDNLPPAARPETSSVTVSPAFDYEAPANSLTIFRIPTRK